MQLVVNGKTFTVDMPGDMPLLWVLRDVIGLNRHQVRLRQRRVRRPRFDPNQGGDGSR